MPRFFRFDFPPFNRLDPAEREQFVGALDIGYYPREEVLVEAGEEPRHLYIIIKGLVKEQRDAETVCLYGPDDNFDAVALMQERSISRFVAEEDVVAYLLPRKMFQTLLRKNLAFASFYDQSINDKLSEHVSEHNRFAMAPLLAAPLRETYLHPAVTVPASMPLTHAAELMRDKYATTLLVETDRGFGLVTSTHMRNAVLIDRRPIDAPVGDIAVANPLSVQIADPLSTAMLVMVEHQVKRVVVLDGDSPVGILDVTDLFSHLSNHSYLAFIQVARATRAEELRQVVDQLPTLIRSLQQNGTRIPHITRLVAEVNRRLLAKLFDLLAPPELREHACLIVMGSEGREEQTLRTDQDNALILGPGCDPAAAREFGRRFSATLREFGYPECAGKMMVEDPDWNRDLAEYQRDVSEWVRNPCDAGMAPIAAILDATAVAGDARLLDRLRAHLFENCSDHDGFLSLFAGPVNAFETPLGLFQRLIVQRGEHSGELDINKGGIFPVMHGARCLALHKRIDVRNTTARLEALCECGLLEARFTADLIEAYEYMLGLRLKSGLAHQAVPARAGGDHYVHADSLGKFETDLLKDSLQLVKAFKNLVAHHFDLGKF